MNRIAMRVKKLTTASGTPRTEGLGPISLSSPFLSLVALRTPPFKATVSAAKMQAAKKVSGSSEDTGGRGAQARTGPRRLGQCMPEAPATLSFLREFCQSSGRKWAPRATPLWPPDHRVRLPMSFSRLILDLH